MANASFTGLVPIGNGGSTSTQTKRVRIASNNGTAIFTGDAMTRTAAGVWGLATAGSGLGGVSLGGSINDSTTNVRKEVVFIPASTTYSSTAFDDHGETDQSFVYIPADPLNVRYRIQYSASTVALTDLTKNANFLASAGSTSTGISGHTLNQATINTTNTLDLAIMDFWHNVLNDPTLTSAKVIVQINVSALPGSAGATGQ